ncbi:hypothetical protein PCANC_27014 [Puccinia coronata f. sp. avenae]|uniref:Tet-like 2OG-Fe(II) oxygenase domain-containing protein n=1 Tax=Puccinia coronata f. sp. avenae TaxID=200324 RepID=A0A2N5S372_9BASI|nr:hypothetical protein PCANC_27014 [Puccinia coronata f. sp. avenae]
MAPFVRNGSGAPAGRWSPSSHADDDDSDNDDHAHNNESSVVDNDALHPCDPASVSEQKDAKDNEKIHLYYVSLSHQQDPRPDKKITSQETLKLYYHCLSSGTCVIAPTNQAASGNGAQTGGMMWADGWRKSLDPGQLVGWFCSLPKMKDAILRAQYNPVSKAAGIQESSDFISFQLQNFAPGVFDSTRQLLINDQDVNLWTLVIWIPIFSPKTRAEDNPILADEGFDMMVVSSPSENSRFILI